MHVIIAIMNEIHKKVRGLNRVPRIVPNSSAGPLPSAFYGRKFRCRQARANRVQATDLKPVFDVERELLGAENEFFR
jgi:hypothetical protein